MGPPTVDSRHATPPPPSSRSAAGASAVDGAGASRLWHWGPALLQMAVITGLSSLPDLGPSPAGISDKAAHALVYAALGALLLRAFAHARWDGVTGLAMFRSLTVASLFGVTDELHQWWVPRRHLEAADVVADVAGAALGIAVVWTWSIIRAARAERKRSPL